MSAMVTGQQVKVVVGGEEQICEVARAMDVAETLRHKTKSTDIPKFFNLDGSPYVPGSSTPINVSAVPVVSARYRNDNDISAEGKSRSETDREAAEKAGFKTADTVYERGSRVVQLGVDNARKSRRDWEKMPLTVDEAHRVRDLVVAEDRQNETQDFFSLRMSTEGLIGVPLTPNQPVPETAKSVTKRAFSSLVTRAGFGGASYLYEQCDPELRSINFNRQMTKLETGHEMAVATAEVEKAAGVNDARIPKRPTVVLGTRKPEGKDDCPREIFRAVTEHYTEFDLDKIAEAFAVAMKDLGGRGRAFYDGNRARLEAIFHSDIQPEDYVAGEFFKSGLTITTDDTGGGSIRGSATVWQNLCLNLIIIDRASQPLFQIRHMGDFNKLVAAFRAGIAKGQEKIGHFLKAWGFATHDNVLEEARKVDEHIPMTVEEALGGFFRGIIDRELVPVKGRKEENVQHLIRMFEEDDSSASFKERGFISRAGIVNAFTRMHTVIQDPWQQAEIESSVSNLIYGRTANQRPAPLPWLPPPSEAKKLGQ